MSDDQLKNNNLKQENIQIKRKTVGLAVGGGFIRSTAAIGAIEVLQENNIPIDLVSGCSSGAAVASAYAAGTLRQFKERLIRGSRREYWRIIFEPTVPKEGLLKGERNRRFFEEFVGDKNFSDLQKKLLILTTDLISMKEVVVDSGRVGRAIQAATSVPGVFVPVKDGSRILVDGGNFNIIPSKILYQKGVDYVIAIHTAQLPNLITRFLSNFKHLHKRDQIIEQKKIKNLDLNILQIVLRAVKISSGQIKNFYYSNFPYDALIIPDITGIKRWHIGRVNYLVNQGRKAAEAMLPKIKSDLGL
ncbi:MAG: hypothetical protein A2729_04520 [Candidatus Buchananbacteria bacterium RIFCSPHIGHO2_01_FULL_39_14]|uniref:PNPLA domain-containing protein n=1 Tax=Candidatus Buchananbacteria bacterium RIFCSPHIGHO2_01_FULL_39_14 TaxID=1797532 RepID=A0A1G1XTP8_9BACT|nr:MAG: hypothetical protein A2729_04520 [Candidatus Buchananbacteria bacterium RIFCSPHIGHO2_01_FULL_39_14]